MSQNVLLAEIRISSGSTQIWEQNHASKNGKTNIWFPLYLEYYCVPVRANQQAPLRQRHSQVQTGSEDLLQAGQRAVVIHSLRIQGLPAGGVQGNVHFSAKSVQKRHHEDKAVNGCLLSFQKHENEFNEAAALRELYKFIQQYFTEVSSGEIETLMWCHVWLCFKYILIDFGPLQLLPDRLIVIFLSWLRPCFTAKAMLHLGQ